MAKRNQPARTILYYPYVEVPTAGPWIRKALLYWDRVAAIVPRSYGYDRRPDRIFNPQLHELMVSGAFHPIDPMGMIGRSDQFRDEIFAAVDHFEDLRARVVAQLTYVPIYKDKSSWQIMDRLHHTGLVLEARDERLVLMESNLAALYMSALAKHIAANEEEFTIPGTDDERYLRGLGGKGNRGQLEPVFATTFKSMIPVPHGNVPLADILGFRERYAAELMSFRAAMDEHDDRVARTTDAEEVKLVAQQLKERITRDVKDLGKAMKASRMDILWGSLQSLIKPTTPTLLGAGAVAAGYAATISTLSVGAAALGAGVGGVIQIGQHIHSNLVQRRQTRQKHPFSYLFLARNRFGRS
ncbi:MAG: hypothetical protein IPM12_13795 [Flavobacteriales bacterium]|nr:hypothetical protein [Flavobacteriales bacterium]